MCQSCDTTGARIRWALRSICQPYGHREGNVHARFGISALAVLALVAVSGCEAGVRDGGQAAPSSPAATPSATGGTTADCHVGSFEVTEIASRRGIPSAI